MINQAFARIFQNFPIESREILIESMGLFVSLHGSEAQALPAKSVQDFLSAVQVESSRTRCFLVAKHG